MMLIILSKNDNIKFKKSLFSIFKSNILLRSIIILIMKRKGLYEELK